MGLSPRTTTPTTRTNWAGTSARAASSGVRTGVRDTGLPALSRAAQFFLDNQGEIGNAAIAEVQVCSRCDQHLHFALRPQADHALPFRLGTQSPESPFLSRCHRLLLRLPDRVAAGQVELTYVGSANR